MSEPVLALMILAMIIGGLLMVEAIRAHDAKRRYRQWVDEREQVLRDLERRNTPGDEDSTNV